MWAAARVHSRNALRCSWEQRASPLSILRRPSVETYAARVPGASIRVGWAEDLPFADHAFDAVLAQLVFGFVSDGELAAREMRRTARPGAPVATCVWDFASGMTVLRAFWDAAHEADPRGAAIHDQANVHKHSTPAELEALWRNAGLSDVASGELWVEASYFELRRPVGSACAP